MMRVSAGPPFPPPPVDPAPARQEDDGDLSGADSCTLTFAGGDGHENLMHWSESLSLDGIRADHRTPAGIRPARSSAAGGQNGLGQNVPCGAARLRAAADELPLRFSLRVARRAL